MDKKFSKYLLSKKPLVKQLVETLNKKYAYVSVLATDVKGTNYAVNRFTTSITPASIVECGFVCKVFNGKGYVEYSFNELTNKNIDKIIEKIQNLADNKINAELVNVGILKEEAMIKDFERKMEGRSYSKEEIISTLKSYVEEGLSFDKELIINCSASIEIASISKMFISNNKELTQFYTWCNPRCSVVARRGENIKYAYDGFGDNSISRSLKELQKRIKPSAKLSIDLLDATAPVPGYYDIITDSSITGLIAHEAFGHGVEMDQFVKDRAQAQEFMNKPVASSLLNMHDGADATFSVASYFFDDDGVLASDTQIIKDGILVSGISDALSALQLGTVPTGNGRRQSYERKAYTRMTNTFFSKGESKLNDMIKSIKHGYMLFQTNNGMEDPKNWGIQCTALYGREIVDGKFSGKLISPVVMSGYVIDLLNSISAISDGFNVIGSGSCGKGYKEWVRVSDGGPNLKAKVRIG